MVGTAPVEHYDRTTTALLLGVKPNSGSLIPELLHYGLLAHAYVGEIFPKNKNPAPEDAGFCRFRSFGFGNYGSTCLRPKTRGSVPVPG